METDEYGSLLNDEEVQVKEKNEVLTKMKSQWSRRCQGKQEDLNRSGYLAYHKYLAISL